MMSKPGDEDAGRVEAVEVGGSFRPAQRGERPQRRREPGVEHVVVGPDRAVATRAGGHVGAGDDRLSTGVAVPGGDPVTPPQLTADAPVAQVVHPLQVHIPPAVGDEPGVPRNDRLDRRAHQGVHLDEPLQRQHRLHHGPTARAVADGVVMLLHPDQQPLGLERRPHRPPGLQTIQAGEVAALLRDHAGDVDDHHRLERVPAGDLEVDEVVGRGHLDRSGTELGVDGIVGDDRDDTAHQGEPHRLSDEVGVAVVVGMDRHPGVPEHGLRVWWSPPRCPRRSGHPRRRPAGTGSTPGRR